MSAALHYPYLDLSPDQVRLLMQAARVERARAIRSFFASLFHRNREAVDWAHGKAPQLICR